MKMLSNPQAVKIRTSDGTTIRGKVNLDSDMKHVDRLSDFFVKGENPFIVVFDVRAMGSDKVVVVNKSHIVWACPDD